MDECWPVTVGVEEEFVLLDPVTGEASPVAPRVLARLGDEPGVTPEFLHFQVETATSVCRSLDEVRADLTRLRRLVSRSAEYAGSVAVATGVAPYGTGTGTPKVTTDRRYLELAKRFPDLVADAGTCACHVHVGIPSRESGVHVLRALRPWLPILLAISANSPYLRGRDSGRASVRYSLWSRWPTARPPASWPEIGDYDADVAEAIRTGAALDARSVYFYARLSPRFPTVEVRIADSCLDVEDSVLLAGLVRGLVITALERDHFGAKVIEDARLATALSIAARHGLAGPGVDVHSGAVVSQARLAERLLEHVRPALCACGDAGLVTRRLAEVVARGGGAVRQRVLRADSGSPGEFVTRLGEATTGGSGAR